MFYKILLAGLAVTFLSGCMSDEERAKRRKDTLEQEPVLVSTKNGVQLWRVYDKECSQAVYFTTPNGDVSWTVPGDEDTPDKHNQVPGVKKKK